MADEEEGDSSSRKVVVMSTTHVQDLPDALLSTILSLVPDARSRNSASLACRRWRHLERSTRTSLVLRGNWRHLFLLPTCFSSVTHVDLSLLSPWGSPLPSLPHLDLSLLRSFPSLSSLSLYSRLPPSLPSLLPLLLHLRLVRWHQRPHLPPGSELLHILRSCPRLSSLDLSSFYFWTEDLPSALLSLRPETTNLAKLDLFSRACHEGFRSHEIVAVAEGCPKLQWLRVPCVFDPRYPDAVGDETLLAIAENCKGLRTLRLLERRAGGEEENGEAKITPLGLDVMFGRLVEMKEFELDCGHLVRESGAALEALKGRPMKALWVGGMQGVCRAGGLHLDGVAAIGGLRELAIRNCGDLTDSALAMIGRGCSRLERFELERCMGVTEFGLKRMVSLLRRTLVDVRISGCKRLSAAKLIRALEPIRDRIQSLHIDCIWYSEEQGGGEKEADEEEHGRDHDHCHDENGESEVDPDGERDQNCELDDQRSKRCRFDELGTFDLCEGGVDFWSRTWDRLKKLSLWIPVGELLTPLLDAGLESCPELEEVSIKVEGDCRSCPKPTSDSFGLISLLHYPALCRMRLDLSEVIGYLLTAPMGHMDLSLWERFYLRGIGDLLGLEELDYWPPQDRDVNQRSLSLPAVGLLSECTGLRKLFIHGTAHEHFMGFLLNIPNLRDVQLREDYYPAPENDTSTEMRVDSCSRFEEALNRRRIPD